jgi:hypothetical protein
MVILWICLGSARASASPVAVLAAPASTGGDSLVRKLLDRLEALQVRQDSFYYAGTFPTRRAWGGSPWAKKGDNSIFYTGLIVFTLQQLKPLLREDERIRCDSITARALRAYGHFRNPSGRPTYNFWPTDHPAFFPNAAFLSHFEKAKKITDDLDDTSILWMGSGIPDSTAKRLKTLMGKHAAGSERRSHSSYRVFRDLPAYSAWFGIKTSVEFDAGVLSNILYFVYAAGLTRDVHDSASLRFLQYVLEKRKYWTDPAFASVYYPRTPVLMYHLGRFMGRFAPDSLEPFRPRLKTDVHTALEQSRDNMDRVILGTTLIRLGDTTSLPPPPVADVERDRFVFYIANISSLFPNPIRRLGLHLPAFIFRFYCPAYNDALLLEYLVLRRERGL